MSPGPSCACGKYEIEFIAPQEKAVLQELSEPAYAVPHHSGFMRLNLKMNSACLALLDDRSDHCFETLAVTLQVNLSS